MSYFINLSILRRNKDFRYLFIGQFVSFFGNMITNVALPYQVYMQTRSTLLVGVLSLSQLLPLLFTALVGGVFADRYHRKMLLISSELILAIGCGLLMLNAHLAEPSLFAIFVIATTMSAFNGLHRPALESIVQQVVNKKDYASVGSLNAFKYGVSMILGPAVGGLIIAHFGIVLTYLVDMMTFVISLVALLLMSYIPKPEKTEDVSTFEAIRKGVRYALSRQELMGSYYVDFVAMIFGMPTALFPAIALQFGGPERLGMLYAAPAVGALFISLFSGWVKHIKRHGAAIAIAACGWGVAIIGFGLTSYFFLAIIFLSIAGAFDAISGIFRAMMWNETIPTHLRGRMAGIEMISYLSGPKLGDAEAGLMAAAFGITFSVVSGGALCVAGVFICCLSLPKFWHYRSEVVQA